ncbi:hypothetical protein [Pseudomonas triticifolii]|uniref:hypothetical protein n=1 Tax=Pseudomonas triticifolii TaxID=2762592 RepID=UPI001F3EBAA9|nr:hypothetical protein [Pseudomonas triticifolii]
MNALTKTLACLGFAGLTGVEILHASEAVNAPSGAPVRNIHLAETNTGGGSSCSFPADAQDVYLNKGNHDCENDEMRFFKLDNVRSAMLIVFESRDCDEEGGWVFKIRTYIDPLTTPWLSIDALRNEQDGAIYSRGVLVESIRPDGDDTPGKLSCVRVIPSGLPPLDAGGTEGKQRPPVN